MGQLANSILVIGGGAAGMMAAIAAAQSGSKIKLFEKNSVLGRKILISGKGRCNVTNARDIKGFPQFYPRNGRFLYSAFSVFSNQDLIRLFDSLGVKTKVERGQRVFPISDRAEEIVNALTGYLHRLGVEVYYNSRVIKIGVEAGCVTGINLADGQFVPGKKIVLTTGGASYPGTGSTGDGYEMAASLGHSVIPLTPALVPLETTETWVKDLQGLTLKNVHVTAYSGERQIGTEFGELLFTHFGVSGPVILTLSSQLAPLLQHGQQVRLFLNLKPALTPEQLDNRLQRDIEKFSRKVFKNSLSDLLPQSLIPVIVQLSGIPGDKPVNQITKAERTGLRNLLTAIPLTVTRTRPLREAIVTAGGVNVKEIDPKTMESKLISGLFFAGKVIDVDGYTGGYNLQAAFSTGFLAGRAAAGQI